jgi:hypothetical protein
VRLVALLGGLSSVLGLEPDQTELVLDIVDHGGLTVATLIIAALLSGGVGTLELEVLVGALQVLAAVTLPKDIEILVVDKVESVGDDLVTGNNILVDNVSRMRPKKSGHMKHIERRRKFKNSTTTNVQCR